MPRWLSGHSRIISMESERIRPWRILPYTVRLGLMRLEKGELPAKFNGVQEVTEASAVGEESDGYVVVIESAEGGVGIDVNDGDGEAEFSLGMAEGLFGDFAEVTSGAGVEEDGYQARSGREP